MSKHDYKNLAGFLDTTKAAPTWACEVQVHPPEGGENAELYASDGIKLASIITTIDMAWAPPLVIEDGAGFLKAAAKTGIVTAAQPDVGRFVFYAGDEVFSTAPVTIGRNYKLLQAQCLADYPPVGLDRLGFYSPHAATLGKVKDSKGKPAVIQLGFRRGHIVFTCAGSTLTGLITSNTLLTEEQPPQPEQGQLI
tara:strand:- start:5299 stop:5883 length:585 start_codon:yes stop_codon:yes gene_type:complete